MSLLSETIVALWRISFWDRSQANAKRRGLVTLACLRLFMSPWKTRWSAPQ